MNNYSFKEFKEAILPKQKLVDIANFIADRKVLPCEKILEEIRDEAEVDESLLGVISIEEHVGRSGERLFTVIVDERYFPPNFLFGAGAAFRSKGVAFVKSGFSKSVEEAVRTHERYHLENGQWSCDPDLHPIIRATYSPLHEAETVLFANLMKDPVATLRTGLEIGLKLPQVIVQYIAHVKSHISKVMNAR